MSLKAWSRHQPPLDLTFDLMLALTLFAISVPLLLSLGSNGEAVFTSSLTESDRTTAKSVQSLRQAIIGQESAGQCGVTNHSGSGAAGLAQVMPENVSAWSLEAIGRSVSVNEFLRDCRLQLRVIDHKLAQYWQQEAQSTPDEAQIVRRVASRWYVGQANWFDSRAPQAWNGRAYPSIRDYTLSVLAAYQRQKAHAGLAVGSE